MCVNNRLNILYFGTERVVFSQIILLQVWYFRENYVT
jgi:hypothetical protein